MTPRRDKAGSGLRRAPAERGEGEGGSQRARRPRGLLLTPPLAKPERRGQRAGRGRAGPGRAAARRGGLPGDRAARPGPRGAGEGSPGRPPQPRPDPAAPAGGVGGWWWWWWCLAEVRAGRRWPAGYRNRGGGVSLPAGEHVCRRAPPLRGKVKMFQRKRCPMTGSRPSNASHGSLIRPAATLPKEK